MRIQILLLLAFALLLAPSAVHAQADLEAVVPFSFHVGDRVLPAGQYAFDIDNGGLIWVNGRKKGLRSTIGSIGVGGGPVRTDSKIVFNRYGSQYFLSEVWTGISGAGRRVNQTRTEEELARNMEGTPLALRAASR